MKRPVQGRHSPKVTFTLAEDLVEWFNGPWLRVRKWRSRSEAINECLRQKKKEMDEWP